MSSKSAKSSSKSRKTSGTPSPDDQTPPVKKFKIPKAFIARPSPVKNTKAVTKVYLRPEVLEAMEFNNSDLVSVSKTESTDQGFIAIICGDEDIPNVNVLGISSPMRKMSGVLLGDRLQISKYSKQPAFCSKTIANVPEGHNDAVTKKLDRLLQDIGLVSPGLQIDFEVNDKQVRATIIDINKDESLEGSMSKLDLASESDDIADIVTPTFIYTKESELMFTEATTIDTTKYPNYPQKTTFEQVGGLTKQIKLLQSTIEVPLHNPKLFSDFGISPPRGILLHGPPGTGKTMLLKSVAENVDAHVLSVSGPSIVSKYLGETENALREIFIEARTYQPSIIFMDEVDSLVPSRSSDDSGETESRVVATLLTMMDGMKDNGRVVIVGATNRPNSIDSALRRPGRFDQEVEIGIPDIDDRYDILSKLVGRMNPQKCELVEEDIRNVSSKTHGYVGADLSALCRESVMKAINRGLKQGIPQAEIKLTAEDLFNSLPDIRPSAMREIFLEMPKVYWTDIGGQHELKRKLVEVVQLPLQAAETFSRLGISAPKGVLLYGPPGCSKTLTAKALATESGLNFLAVKGPEIFNKYVGESERAIREIFRKARAASPSIIFFDEIDAISGDRDSANTGAAQQVLTSLLNEIDGVEELKGVIIVGATNRPTEIDPALLRPGRLDRHIYVGAPDHEARLEILKKCCRKFNLSEEVDFDDLATATDGCSGAEVTLLCQESGLAAIMEDNDATNVQRKHFDHALKGISKGITPEMLEYYSEFAKRTGLSV